MVTARTARDVSHAWARLTCTPSSVRQIAGRATSPVHTDRWKVDDFTGVDPFRNLHVQQIVRATMGERVGVGVFEQLALGPHEPSGFTELLDGAR